MKQILIIAFVFIASATIGQTLNTNTYSTIKIENVDRPAISVVMEPEISEIEKSWKKYTKKQSQIKFSKNSNLFSAKNVLVGQVTDKHIDFYFQLMNIEGKTEFSVSSALGYDVYIDKTNYPTEFSALESYLNQFKKEFLVNFYSKKVKKLQKEEKKLQKSFEKQVKKQEKLTKQNEKNNKTIEKLQNKIEKNIKKTEEHKEKEIIFGKDKLKKSEELKDKQSILNSL